MEKLRRKICMEDGERMVTLYKVLCKYGTHGTTVAYLFGEPKVGACMNAIVDDGAAYVTDDNLRYRPIVSIRITDIRESDGFIFVERF